MFPAGAPGAALLLLRLSAASLVFVASSQFNTLPTWMIVGFVMLAAALVLGFFTRVAAGISAVLAASIFVALGGTLGFVTLLHAFNAIALAILGPGAYSIDARRFGRRVIKLDN
jgi:uncharacterized membrane protein YphA (DoxX/SURF4 family)